MNSEIFLGFTGKIPARGDFVHARLPRDFTDPWHDWQSLVIAGSRTMMGDAWLEAFLEAPVWRFALPPGLCGARAAVGLIMPSVDRVGRYFPLTFAALTYQTMAHEAWSSWLDATETLGRHALEDDWTPDKLIPPAAPRALGASGLSSSYWWSAGGPRVEATAFTLPALPTAEQYAAMLGHNAMAPRVS